MSIHPAIIQTAKNLMVNPEFLDILINFETAGTYDPQIKNPYSSARGLIQFIDSTAKELGFQNSLELVQKFPTIETQMKLVELYLKKYAPFKDLQSLAMSIFYPKYRNVPITTPFPDNVIAVNPTVRTPLDYINKMTAAYKKKSILPITNQNNILPLLVGAGLVLWLIMKKK